MTRLIRHYAKLERFEAISALVDAVQSALASVKCADHRSRAYPATYAALADLGLSWFRIGRYWFSHTDQGGDIVITNVFYDQANIPRRVARS